MTIDNVVCPECKGEDITEVEEHNLLNLAFGLSIGLAMGSATQYISLMTFGPMFYFFDIPFGPERQYYCNKCDNSWAGD